jgi:hypothetical protein
MMPKPEKYFSKGSQLTDPDVIGFYWWWEDGVRHYRCRGIGPKYTDFYHNWIPTSSYRCTGDDWPWDFFVFDDPADHERLIAKFPDDVVEDSD